MASEMEGETEVWDGLNEGEEEQVSDEGEDDDGDGIESDASFVTANETVFKNCLRRIISIDREREGMRLVWRTIEENSLFCERKNEEEEEEDDIDERRGYAAERRVGNTLIGEEVDGTMALRDNNSLGRFCVSSSLFSFSFSFTSPSASTLTPSPISASPNIHKLIDSC